MLLQVWLQFCSNRGFVDTSGVIMLFYQSPYHWTIEYYVGCTWEGKQCGFAVLGLIIAQSIIHIVQCFQPF